MFSRIKKLFSSSTKSPAAKRQSRRPRFETLEDRNLMTSYLILDFTPDAIQGESFQAGSFASGFNLRYSNGKAPRFLDFNGDRRVNSKDVKAAARSIAYRVADYFSWTDFNLQYGDLGGSNWGTEWLNYGWTSEDQVFVAYVGGYPLSGEQGVLGEAFQAYEGYNMEYYCMNYFSEAVTWFMRNAQGARPADLAQEVALTIAHEVGHLMGLGHVWDHPAGDPNIMNYSADKWSAYFPDSWYEWIDLTDSNGNQYWGWQNPAQEIRDSLWGQPDMTWANWTYSNFEGDIHYKVTVDELFGEHHHDDGTAEHEHGSDEETAMSAPFANMLRKAMSRRQQSPAARLRGNNRIARDAVAMALVSDSAEETHSHDGHGHHHHDH